MSDKHPLRDLTVQLTGSSEDEVRLRFAKAIAATFDAHLIGVHLHQLPDILDITNPAESRTVREWLEESDREADVSFRTLTQRFGELEVSHELRRLHGLSDTLGSDLATVARTADLFIGTRPYGDPGKRRQIEEHVLFGSGRGCLFIPPGGSPRAEFQNIGVAWDGSREASRAIAEAMPFLVRANEVHLVSIAPLADEKDMTKRSAAMCEHLHRHAIKAQATILPYTSGTGERLEQFAHQKGSNLLVMGAYGHNRLLEWVFGGATRYILRHSTLPVLMAH